MKSITLSLTCLAVTLYRCQKTIGFSPMHLSRLSTNGSCLPSGVQPLFAVENADKDDADLEVPAKLSLEEKIAQWDATEDEKKAASLGGIVPGSRGDENRSDAFDIGLYIAFPFMIAASLLFAVFPLIMDKIDVTSVGPPPTM